MSAVKTLRSRFAHGRFGAVALALTLVAVSGCKKKPTTPPTVGGPTADETDALVAEAKAATLIDLANKDLESGRYMSAIRRADEALATDDKNADAYAILGAAKWRQGDFSASSAAYESALEIDAKNFGAVLGFARNLQAQGQHKRAIEIQTVLVDDDKTQIAPRVGRLWSHYATADADAAIEELDALFQHMPADDPQLALVQAYNGFMRPFAGQGTLCEVEGASGKMDAGIDHGWAVKYSSAIINGEFSKVLFLETAEESVIDTKLVKTLGLDTVGKFTPAGTKDEVPLVLVREVKFGDLVLKNVPAMVRDLSVYTERVGERPGLVLGRQALQALGSYTFDYPNNSMTVTKDAPSAPPEGATETALLLVSAHLQIAPAISVRLEKSEHDFFVYLGGAYPSGVAVTRKNFLKSDHLPRELENPENADAGQKMVYLDDVVLGTLNLGGMGGLVLSNTPPDPALGMFLNATSFELGGYINTRLMATWAVTYALGEGKVYINPS